MMPPYRIPAERFWEKVDVWDPDHCWTWTGCKDKRGYGRFGLQTGHVINAHRLMYLMTFGGAPVGSHIDNLCLNTSCVNPKHLQAVPRSVNIRRGYRANGLCGRNLHPFVPENRGAHGQCLPCARAADRKRRPAQGLRNPVALCGTRSGYYRHRMNGEYPCADCRSAHNEYIKAYKRARDGFQRGPDTNAAGGMDEQEETGRDVLSTK